MGTLRLPDRQKNTEVSFLYHYDQNAKLDCKSCHLVPFCKLTWLKYSCDILLAHATHRSTGLVGLATSEHFMSIRLINARFSGVVRDALSGVLWPLCYGEVKGKYERFPITDLRVTSKNIPMVSPLFQWLLLRTGWGIHWRDNLNHSPIYWNPGSGHISYHQKEHLTLFGSDMILRFVSSCHLLL